MAWTGNFKDQIDNLAGTLTVSDDAAIQQWILDGCYDVMSKAVGRHGEEEVWKFVAKSGNQTSNGIDVDEIRTIAGVMRNNVFAVKGKFGLKAKYADSGSIYAATASSPVWYLDDSTLNIYPAPDVSSPANYYYVPEYILTNWNSSTSSINHYPSEYYYHTMLYASIQVLARRMLDLSAPTALSEFSITAVAPDEIPSPAIVSPTVSTVALADITGSLPTYTLVGVGTSATLGALATLAIDDLSITAVVPDAPTIATISYTNVVPATATVADIVAVTDASLTSITGASSDQPTYIGPDSVAIIDASTELAKMKDYINTEEDTELSGAKGQEINAKISEFNAKLQKFSSDMQDSQNTFNENNAIYTALVQQATQNANAANQNALQIMQKDQQINQANNQKLTQVAQINTANAQQALMQDAIQQVQDVIANNNALIQEYQANLSVYQAEVGTEVQEYTNNLQKKSQLWQQTNSTILQEHSQKMQDSLNVFNKENAQYQANVQAQMSKFQVDAADAMKEADLTIQAQIQDYTFELQKWQQSLGQYQADVNTEVTEYSNNLQRLSANLAATKADYEWLDMQYNKLRFNYESFFGNPASQGAPAQAS
jgi:hypothetical protein